MADVQGFLTLFNLDGSDVTLQCNSVGLSQAKNVMSKPTMDGTGNPTKLTGQKTGTLTAAGQVDTVGFGGLNTTWEKDTAVAFSLRMGDGAGVQAGTYSGNVTLSALDVDSSADDTWNFEKQTH